MVNNIEREKRSKSQARRWGRGRWEVGDNANIFEQCILMTNQINYLKKKKSYLSPAEMPTPKVGLYTNIQFCFLDIKKN